jgi:hypothetical protein
MSRITRTPAFAQGIANLQIFTSARGDGNAHASYRPPPAVNWIARSGEVNRWWRERHAKKLPICFLSPLDLEASATERHG